MREYSTPAQFTVADNDSVVHTVFTQAEKTPHRVMYSRPLGDEWVAVTASQFAEQVAGVAKGLIAGGVQPGDRVALLSATRYEWSLFDYAIWAAGAASVPIYDSSSTEQIRWILEDSGACLAIVETAAHEALFVGMPDTLGEIHRIDGGAVDASSMQAPASTTASSPLAAKASAPTTSPRSSTPPAPPAGPRAACSLTGTSSRRSAES